ncbi:uncharacterized protein si:ch73-109d9.1 isoform X4 [Megalobrama amblycephala]|uniref:uncharacterized protein si:ch73-109d9.1 isoform X4 n=1 Tax=Megalobrama amblycephala TaxID=75352 RepID=UPI002013CB47|nr:uncharacterized protein si:ch73-109d9.1 isoform X4 [Megalobrama amblycephala]
MSEALFLTFQSQLSVVMETVLKSAMFEITRLVEDSFLEEVGHRKQEVEVLKRRLQLSESKLREKEREWERGRKTRCSDCGRKGDSSSRDESQHVETVRGANTLCLGLSLRDQSTNQPKLTEEMWSTRQRLESNKQTTTTTTSHSKEKNDVHRHSAKEIITPNSNAPIPQDFLQRLLGNSAIQSESTSDFKPKVNDLDQSEKDFTLDKEMDSNHSRLIQSPSAQDVHEVLPSSSPNDRVKSETELDLLPVKEEEEMVPVWDSVNRDDGCHAEMADPSEGELRGSCDQEEIQIGRSFADHSSMEQGNSHPINKQRTFSVVAREILTQFQVWQRACYSRNIEWGPITAKIISALPQLYGREAEVIVRCTKMLHNRRDYLRRRAKMHITVLKKGEGPCISKCTQCCDKYHCPFCETWVYKPRELGSVVNHVKNHLKLAVQLHDFSIVKCNLKCRQNAHFHCCYCSATVVRKVQLHIHLSKCIQKITAEEEFEEDYSLDGSPKHE